MEEFKYISFTLWVFTATILSIFFVISLMVYVTNREKLFKYYALYCLFTLLYVLYKFDFYPNFLHNTLYSSNKSFGISIQLVYHAYYMLFGLLFLKLAKFKPKFKQFIEKYAYSILILGCLMILAGFFNIFSRNFYRIFFTYIFLPVHLSLAFVIIGVIVKVKSLSKYYFIIGTLIYMFFSMYAYVLSYNRALWYNPYMEPIDFFYIAIILECFVFSYGLAQFVRTLYNEKQQVQRELAQAQRMVQARLEERIELQEKEKKLLKEEKDKQELIAEVLNLKQKVMRSQINSHFIFNVLNSIKLFIMENDSQKAYFYLNKFAKFIRHVLDNSLREYSTLQEELENIELYLNIEKMRFNDKFSYQINVDDNVMTSGFRFPALLLQPFVENALWHGLMQVEKNATLIIRVTGNNQLAKIVIDDNGVGFNFSKSKQEKMQRHKSMGIALINERIAHFNKRAQNYTIDYEIVDKQQQHIGKGTRVIMNLHKNVQNNNLLTLSHADFIASLKIKSDTQST